MSKHFSRSGFLGALVAAAVAAGVLTVPAKAADPIVLTIWTFGEVIQPGLQRRQYCGRACQQRSQRPLVGACPQASWQLVAGLAELVGSALRSLGRCAQDRFQVLSGPRVGTRYLRSREIVQALRRTADSSEPPAPTFSASRCAGHSLSNGSS